MVADLGIELGPALGQQGAGLLDPGGGHAQIVVIGQGGVDEGLQRGVLKQLPPSQVAQGIGEGAFLMAEGGGRMGVRAGEVGANGAACKKQEAGDAEDGWGATRSHGFLLRWERRSMT